MSGPDRTNEILYRGRRAVRLETAALRVTLTVEGCHVAEILHKETGANPLSTPPWPSIEPSRCERAAHTEYGDEAELRILAGMIGHSICLDTYGAPSPEELAAGMPVHGEGAVERISPPQWRRFDFVEQHFPDGADSF